jgi:hypothetical protein
MSASLRQAKQGRTDFWMSLCPGSPKQVPAHETLKMRSSRNWSVALQNNILGQNKSCSLLAPLSLRMWPMVHSPKNPAKWWNSASHEAFPRRKLSRHAYKTSYRFTSYKSCKTWEGPVSFIWNGKIAIEFLFVVKICSGVRLTGQQGCVTHLAISNDSTVKQFQQCCVLPTTLLLQTVGLACESSRVGQIQGRYCQHPLDIQIPTSQPWRLGIALNLRIGLLCIVWNRHKQAEEVFFACDSNCRCTQFPAHSREHMKNCKHGHFHKTTTEQSTNKFGV